MVAVRVTQGMMITRSLNDLSYQTRRILKLQEQLATGHKVNSPSDDPLAVRRAVNIKATIAKEEQYQSNISQAGVPLLESTAAIQTVVNAVQRSKELALQGASATQSTTQMGMIATEVNQLLEGVLDEANHQTNKRFIFGGTRTMALPFVATRNAQNQITSVTYNGNDQLIEVPVSDGSGVKINEPGDRTFMGSVDIFNTLIQLRDQLNAGDKNSIQTRMSELETAQTQLLTSLSNLGAVQNRLDTLTEDKDDQVQQLQMVLSDNIDADYSETVLNLNAQSNAFQAALNAAARVIQPSLLDYVR